MAVKLNSSLFDFWSNYVWGTDDSIHEWTKARELENIVEEHCYNNNKDYYEEMDDIRSDDTEDNSNRDDENEGDDDDTCALLQLDLTVTSINLPEIQEVDTMAIAKQKAILAAQLVNGPCVVEDTSLEFHALGGMPGPYIKWFQETLKSQGMRNSEISSGPSCQTYISLTYFGCLHVRPQDSTIS